MKQNITLEQLAELSDEVNHKLGDYYLKHFQSEEDKNNGAGYDQFDLCLSIGQMVEFLIKHDAIQGAEYGQPTLPSYQDWKSYPDMICDDLWKEVKQILET